MAAGKSQKPEGHGASAPDGSARHPETRHPETPAFSLHRALDCPASGEPGELFEMLNLGDGTHIRLAHWLPPTTAATSPHSKPRGTIILLQGRREFIEKYYETVADLLDRGFAVLTLDWHGQGLSTRPLANRHKGHVDDFDRFETELAAATAHRLAHLPRPYHILAHSMGAHVALRFLHNHPGLISRAVLTAPMIAINFGALAPISRGLVALMMRMGRAHAFAFSQHGYTEAARRAEGRLLSSDPLRLQVEIEHCRKNPALALGGVTYGWLCAAFRSIAYLTQEGYPEDITTPILVVTAGADQVVSNAAQTTFARRLKSGLQLLVPGARHEILMERDDLRNQFWDAFDEFIAREQQA